MANGSQHASEPSLTWLLGGLLSDARALLLRELTLAKHEAQRELGKVKAALVSLGIGVGVCAIGGALLILMLVHLLKASTEIPLWGCYGLIASLCMLLGAVLLYTGIHKIGQIDVVPQKTLDTLKEIGNGSKRKQYSTGHTGYRGDSDGHDG